VVRSQGSCGVVAAFSACRKPKRIRRLTERRSREVSRLSPPKKKDIRKDVFFSLVKQGARETMWFEVKDPAAETPRFLPAENQNGSADSRSGAAAKYPAYLHERMSFFLW